MSQEPNGEQPPGNSGKRKPAEKAKSLAPEKKKPAAKTKAPSAHAKCEGKIPRKRADHRNDLVRELAQVRECLATSAQAFAARLDGEFARILCVLEGESLHGIPEPQPSPRALATMLMAIRQLKVKPEKGRFKDLERLADLADVIARLLPQDE
jgi:hypothetical protein